MNRILLLLIPIVAFAATPTFRAGQTGGGTGNPAKEWADSLTAESDKKYDVALVAVTAYQKEGGDTFLATERTGWLRYLNGDYVQAESAYIAASRLQSSAINPLLGMLNIAQAQKDAKKTESAAQAVLHIEPSNYRALMALAGTHLYGRDYPKAASEYRRVLTFYPDDTDAMSGLAWSTYYGGNKRDSVDIFKKILSVSPSYPYAQRGYDLATGTAPARPIN